MVSLTEQHDYFWRVRIKAPETGPWSDTFRFTIVAPEKRFAISKGSSSERVLEVLRKAAATAKAGQTVEVDFEKGEYTLGPLNERVAFWLDHVLGFRIEGNGSAITWMGPFCSQTSLQARSDATYWRRILV
jgi:hypothetical protein